MGVVFDDFQTFFDVSGVNDVSGVVFDVSDANDVSDGLTATELDSDVVSGVASDVNDVKESRPFGVAGRFDLGQITVWDQGDNADGFGHRFV